MADASMKYIKVAEVISKSSTCLRRQYGAVIVKDDEIVSTGYNGAPRKEPNCTDLKYCLREVKHIPHGERSELCRSVHAEMNAIISAGRKLCIGSDLYLYGYDLNDQASIVPAPCMMCRRFIVQAGIKRIITINDFGDGLEITEVKPQESVYL